jgi:hypothetical protein
METRGECGGLTITLCASAARAARLAPLMPRLPSRIARACPATPPPAGTRPTANVTCGLMPVRAWLLGSA